jgi:hypothetical protein
VKILNYIYGSVMRVRHVASALPGQNLAGVRVDGFHRFAGPGFLIFIINQGFEIKFDAGSRGQSPAHLLVEN